MPPFITAEMSEAGGNGNRRKSERDESQSGKQHPASLRPPSIKILGGGEDLECPERTLPGQEKSPLWQKASSPSFTAQPKRCSMFQRVKVTPGSEVPGLRARTQRKAPRRSPALCHVSREEDSLARGVFSFSLFSHN